MDLSNLSVEDLQHLQKRDYDSMSPEGLMEFQKQRAATKGAMAQAQNPQQIPDSADKAAQGGKPDAKPISMMRGAAQQDISGFNEMDPDVKRGFGKAIVGAAAGEVAAPVAGLEGLLGVGARVGANALAGAGQQVVSNAMDQKPLSDDVGFSAAVNAATSGLGETGSALASFLAGKFKSGANSLMARAIGLKGVRNLPEDIGNRIVDQGIVGTKAQMATQVASKYASAEDKIQSLAKDLKGSVSGDTLSSAVKEKGARFVDPMTGAPFSAGEAGDAAFSDVAHSLETKAPGYTPGTPQSTSTKYMVDNGEKVPLSSTTTPASPASQGSYGGSGLLSLKRLGDEQAFNQSGLMGNTYKAEAYRSQADAAREALAKLSEGEMPKALKDEQTLLYANKGLMKPQPITSGTTMSDAIPAAVGAAVKGLPGVGTAVLASHAAGTPLAQSVAAHGLQRVASPVAQGAANAAKTAVTPETQQTLQGLFRELLQNKSDNQ